jgi:hypothetical protein
VLFRFVSRKFSPKLSEDGFLENRGFLGIGLEKKGFRKKWALEKTFEYDIRIQHRKTNIEKKFKSLTQNSNLGIEFQIFKSQIV